MEKLTQVTYAHTVPEVRSLFRRGYENVLLFFPKEGRSVRVTPSTLKRVVKKFKESNGNRNRNTSKSRKRN